jgi:hypothetical protein
VRFRLVGLPPGDSVTVANGYPRPPEVPGRQALRVLLPQGCDARHHDDFIYDDFAVLFGGSVATETVDYSPAYLVRLVNVTRACNAIVPAGCMQEFTRDQCLTYWTTRLTEEHGGGKRGPAGSIVFGAGAAGGGSGGGGGGGGGGGARLSHAAIACIALAAAAVLAAAAAGAGFAAARWRAARRAAKGGALVLLTSGGVAGARSG